MAKYTTKYFGEISIDETSDYEYIDVQYKNTEINISFSDCNIYGDKIRICLNILDKYAEINENGKKRLLKISLKMKR